ncbi:LOG family protein [Arsenicicoccus piscis]|uniref:Rossmann fold nucleotide-binding protein n=1 Tax=Arsenicicoccus piscis TaxID=673954 RepID=A0ABQ6HP66_9MICO|nr:LOG family protein [Arsenicicoccus piscis]GMA20181.1 hypothetical protein GCM10025862_22020 [Arsenicicoccus piscis]
MEITDPADLARLLADGGSLRRVRVQGVDLAGVEEALLAREDLRGLVVLGGRVSPRLADHLNRHGAVVFPVGPGAPVDVYRGRLYAPEELYAGLAEHGYARTPDARAYGWSRDVRLHGDPYVSVLRSLHDDAMNDALDELVEGRSVVGVMGGHDIARGSEAYAGAARLGLALAQAGLLVVTGGGPGAMEAANLGAYAAHAGSRDEAARWLDDTLAALAPVPTFVPDVGAWAAVALQARAALAGGGFGGAGVAGGVEAGDAGTVRSVGIPTWFYGHEPPNVFCDAIAKFFSNALREDGLLARSNAGVVVLPGAAGTVQEVFQAVTRMYYRLPADGPPPPLVLVDREHWTEALPVVPLVSALGRGRAMEQSVALVGSIDDVLGELLPQRVDGPLV